MRYLTYIFSAMVASSKNFISATKAVCANIENTQFSEGKKEESSRALKFGIRGILWQAVLFVCMLTCLSVCTHLTDY